MFAGEELSINRSGSPASISTPSRARAPSQVQPIIGKRDDALQLHVHPDRDANDENDIVWTDPSSGATFLIDKKTGHSYPRTSLWPSVGEDNARTMNTARRTIDSADSGSNERQAPQWILDALKDNCAYFIKEEPVPAVSQRLPTVLSSEHIASAAGATYFSGSLAFTFDETSTWGLKRGDLSRMKVINQLDRKFIVCVLILSEKVTAKHPTSQNACWFSLINMPPLNECASRVS
ncbi:hypothetical protein BGW80DRAFT_765257 [Lactifluus volemus]|nr:hypothetical protein BGW80DRAFT_765257 [Lactifluus volemus]